MKVMLKSPVGKIVIMGGGRRIYCWYNPKIIKAERTARNMDRIAKLRALAEHPSTPPHEALAARKAIKRLS